MIHSAALRGARERPICGVGNLLISHQDNQHSCRRVYALLFWVHLDRSRTLTDSGNWQSAKDFLNALSKTHEDWQIDQASEALKYYQYYLGVGASKKGDKNFSAGQAWKALVDEMVNLIRLKHLAPSTEKAYIMWLRQFYRFVNGKAPGSISGKDIRQFLSHLAVERNVSASTQNQAFNSLLFFFRHVLEKEEIITQIQDAVRARRKSRLPVVISRQEVGKILEFMENPYQLMCRGFIHMLRDTILSASRAPWINNLLPARIS